MKLDEAKKVLQIGADKISGEFAEGIRYALEIINQVSEPDASNASPIGTVLQKKPSIVQTAAAGPPTKKTAVKMKTKGPNYKPKTCSRCHKEFIPNSGAQTICDDCKAEKESISKVAKEIAGID